MTRIPRLVRFAHRIRIKLRKSRLLRWGASLTAIWIGAVLLYLITIADLTQIRQPNNFGDFLAGAFAPVAFFWLILTTLMQSNELTLQRKELSLSRDVLRLQAQELSHLVAQYAEQVSLLKEAREEERGDRMAEGVDVAIQNFFRLFLLHCGQFNYAIMGKIKAGPAINVFIRGNTYKPVFDAADWTSCSEQLLKNAINFRSFRESQPRVAIEIDPGFWAHLDLLLHDLDRLIKRTQNVRNARVAELSRSLRLAELRDEVTRISKLDTSTVTEGNLSSV